MGPRILLQMVLFALPFILFGIYRIAITEAEQEGRKPWPIRALFGAGLGLAIGGWLILIVLDRIGGEVARRAERRNAASADGSAANSARSTAFWTGVRARGTRRNNAWTRFLAIAALRWALALAGVRMVGSLGHTLS